MRLWSWQLWCLSLSVAQTIHGRRQRYAQAIPVDGLTRIDIARKGGRRRRLMMWKAVRGCARAIPSFRLPDASPEA